MSPHQVQRLQLLQVFEYSLVQPGQVVGGQVERDQGPQPAEEPPPDPVLVEAVAGQGEDAEGGEPGEGGHVLI